jgi:hypothetical protein
MMHGRTLRHNSTGTKSGPRSRGSAALLSFAWRAAPPITLAAVHLAAAGSLGADLIAGVASFPLQGSCALVFGCIGGWFARAAYRSVTTRTRDASYASPLSQRRYWCWCGICLISCYAVALPFGARTWAAYVFWTSFALCHWAIWCSHSGSIRQTSRLSRLTAQRPLRIAAWTLYAFLMLPAACELGLRLYALAADDRLAVRYVTGLLKFPAGGERLGRTVNSQGYWDDEFLAPVLPAALRVAALGDDAVLCGDAQSNFLAQVERLLPGVDVLNFGVPQTSPREYASQFQSAVAPCRPDLLLVFFSVGTDVTEAPPLPGPFDWRGLHLVQRSLGFVKRTENAAVDPAALVAADDIPGAADCVDRAADVLQVCRVPVPEAVQSCWRAAFEHLDRVVFRCLDEGVMPTLVVVPSEFQIDERLCQMLCRRAGYRRADQIDIDLPQRRLAAYAKDRRIQLLDLMPHMRASKTPTYVSDAAQFNEHGNALAATILSEWLQTQYGPALLADGS